jgi:hypothetical protein
MLAGSGLFRRQTAEIPIDGIADIYLTIAVLHSLPF